MDEERTHRVTLGCGTLILIALIVMFFSRPGVQDLEHEVRLLRTDITDLKREVEVQTREIKRLQDKLDPQKAR